MSEFWEKAIQGYGNFITYPQLSDKYLKRPPFKYLFQIFASLNTKTKFADGLFKEGELDADFYDSPEKKLAFLKQLFKLVSKLIGRECAAKPQSVVKGVDCDKTNEFLLDMLAACKSGKTYAKLMQEGEQKPTAVAAREAEKPAKSATHPPAPSKEPEKVEKIERVEKVERPEKVEKAEKISIDKTLEKEKEKEKENVAERKAAATGGDRHTKVVQHALDAAVKEEKIVERARPQSKDQQLDAGIKMGSLGLSNGKGGKNRSVAGGSKAGGGETQTGGLVGGEPNLEEIRQAIQKLTQNAGPLGKLVEFIDDDLDGMNKECKRWQKMHAETSAKLEKMEADLDEELQSYHDKLNEINEQAFDTENKICLLRSRILKNGTKIDLALSKLISN